MHPVSPERFQAFDRIILEIGLEGPEIMMSKIERGLEPTTQLPKPAAAK